jgi:hypothetical protein
MPHSFKRSVRERFDAGWIPEPNSGCWLWTGYLDRGYGHLLAWRKDGSQGMRAAYKVGYEEYIGPVSDGLELDHKCRVRSCVNPWHLEPVTHAENIRRGRWQPAVNVRKTQCDRGHPYADDTMTNYGGHRKCMTCNKMTCLDRYYKKTGRPHLSPLYCERV